MRELEITEAETKHVQACLAPDPKEDRWLAKPMYLITRLKKYITGSPVIPARVKGFAMILAERVDPHTCETTWLSYAQIAALVASPRPGEHPTISRRNAIENIADLEAFGLLQTEVRRPVARRDPNRPKNWKNLFRLCFPPHALAAADPHMLAALTIHDDGVDEQRSEARDSIEAEAAGREPRHEDLDDVEAGDAPAPPAQAAQTIFEKLAQAAQAAQAAATTKRPDPPAPTRVAVANSAAAPTELELAITAARLRSTERGIAEILGLYKSQFSSLPRDFARTTSEFMVREGHSLTKALNGIEQSLRKLKKLRNHQLAAFITSCIAHVVGDPTTASKVGKRIVRAVEIDLATEIAALQNAARGRDPPPQRRA